MAQGRVNYWVQKKEADYHAALVVDRVRIVINSFESDKGLMEILNRYDVWSELVSQFEDFLNAAYVELPDDAG